MPNDLSMNNTMKKLLRPTTSGLQIVITEQNAIQARKSQFTLRRFERNFKKSGPKSRPNGIRKISDRSRQQANKSQSIDSKAKWLKWVPEGRINWHDSIRKAFVVQLKTINPSTLAIYKSQSQNDNRTRVLHRTKGSTSSEQNESVVDSQSLDVSRRLIKGCT